VQIVNHVAEVALTPTGKGQRMGPDYWDQLPSLFEQLDADPEVRAVLVYTPAEHFSFGLDLVAMSGELAELTVPDANATVRTRFLATVKKMQRTHNAVTACRKPVIAAVNGYCIGGGVDLITACDIRLAASNAKNPPLTVQGIKQVMNFTSEREAALSLDAVQLWNSAFFPSEDLQEAMASFMEKREPQFKGR
jgi:enoyl-CoA hydratase/carnithine racemase